MENSNLPSADRTAAPAGPGQLLQQARKELRLAPEDVAQMLHLSSKQILALEQDDYNHLPGPTYIRGYLRSYAQLLGLSPDKILESYARLMTPSKPISLPKSAPPPQITSSNRLIKAATVGVVAMVLGLVYLWWRSDEDPAEHVGSSPAVIGQVARDDSDRVTANSSSSTAVSHGDGTITSALNQPPVRGGVVEPILQPSPHDSPAPGAAAVSASPAAAKAGLAKEQVTVSDMIANVSPGQAPKQANTVAAATADRAMTRKRESPDIPPGAQRSRLVLHATQESWADVRDARDNKLLYENVPAGRSISIEGMAPFSVFLGNADGVRVEFNGQNFDVSRYRRGQVARFTLGENPAVNN